MVDDGIADQRFPEFRRQTFLDCAIVWRTNEAEPQYVQCLDTEGIVTESSDQGVRLELVSTEKLGRLPVFEHPQFVETVPAPLVELIHNLKACKMSHGCGKVFDDERVELLASIDPSSGAWLWKDSSYFLTETVRPVAYFFVLDGNIIGFHGIGTTPWKVGNSNVFRFFIVENSLG